MKEAKILGELLPSHPDLLPIVNSVREKYRLKPVCPDDEPIEEIYLEEYIRQNNVSMPLQKNSARYVEIRGGLLDVLEFRS